MVMAKTEILNMYPPPKKKTPVSQVLLFCKPKCWFSCVGGEGSHLFRLAVEWMKLGSWPNLFAGARLGFTLNDRLVMKCDGSLTKDFSSKQLITNMNYVVWTQYPNMWHHMHPHTHTYYIYIYILYIYVDIFLRLYIVYKPNGHAYSIHGAFGILWSYGWNLKRVSMAWWNKSCRRKKSK